jgi:hypothetical protein
MPELYRRNSVWGDTPLELRKRNQPRRCQCGECRECQELARWDRIFSEKFADPTYYNERPPRSSSALSSL